MHFYWKTNFPLKYRQTPSRKSQTCKTPEKHLQITTPNPTRIFLSFSSNQIQLQTPMHRYKYAASSRPVNHCHMPLSGSAMKCSRECAMKMSSFSSMYRRTPSVQAKKTKNRNKQMAGSEHTATCQVMLQISGLLVMWLGALPCLVQITSRFEPSRGVLQATSPGAH